MLEPPSAEAADVAEAALGIITAIEKSSNSIVKQQLEFKLNDGLKK